MTERLAEIAARVDGIRQLGAVVNAMRGIAAARAQQARGQLASVDNYAATVAAAIGQVLALQPRGYADGADRGAGLALVLFCAEQGFAGAFSERILDAVGPDLTRCTVYLIGSRGGILARERGLVPDWMIAMPSRSAGIPKLADRIVGALYPAIATRKIGRLEAIFSQRQPGHGNHVERRSLFPVDTATFASDIEQAAPYLTLEPAMLLADLTAAYLHAQLCNAALHAFAAENEARLESMTAARTQIDRQLTKLQARQRTVRQDEITEEIIELAAGETATYTKYKAMKPALDRDNNSLANGHK